MCVEVKCVHICRGEVSTCVEVKCSCCCTQLKPAELKSAPQLTAEGCYGPLHSLQTGCKS